MLWPLRSKRDRKNSDHDLAELDETLRKESEGDTTACEDWSDMEEASSLGDLIVTPSDDLSSTTLSPMDENDTPRRTSRFSIFQRSGPMFRSSDEDLPSYSEKKLDEQVPQAQVTPTLRHIVRVSENIPAQDESSEANTTTREKAYNKTTSTVTKTTPTVGNPYQVTKEAAPLPSTTRGKLEVSLFCVYLCCCVVLALPVMLLPVVSADITSQSQDGTSVASFAASVASVATLGAGIGKVVNGFVCKWLGGRQSSFLYLLGMAACSLFLSKTSRHVGLAMGGIEFFCSIQFTSMALLLNNHYECDVTKLTYGMTTVSFASTAGMLVANFFGTALLQRLSWRRVAQFGAVVSLVGALIIHVRVREFPTVPSTNNSNTKSVPIKDNERLTLRGVVSSIRHVLGSRLFWQVGVAHAMAFLARTSDRVLGTFFQETTSLPHNVCGGLLACLAIGYFHGLMSGKEITLAKTTVAKSRLLKKRYLYAVLSTLFLALVANKRVISTLQRQSNKWLILAVALSSGSMASFLSFQIYLLPSMVANTFGKNKPVCLSFFDGLGYFLASPIWATTSRIVSHPLVGPHGWSVNFAMLALFFAIAGVLMMRALPPVLNRQTGESSSSTSKEQQHDSCSEIGHQA